MACMDHRCTRQLHLTCALRSGAELLPHGRARCCDHVGGRSGGGRAGCLAGAAADEAVEAAVSRKLAMPRTRARKMEPDLFPLGVRAGGLRTMDALSCSFLFRPSPPSSALLGGAFVLTLQGSRCAILGPFLPRRHSIRASLSTPSGSRLRASTGARSIRARCAHTTFEYHYLQCMRVTPQINKVDGRPSVAVASNEGLHFTTATPDGAHGASGLLTGAEAWQRIYADVAGIHTFITAPPDGLQHTNIDVHTEIHTNLHTNIQTYIHPLSTYIHICT
jgi:hypothetical protein